MFRKANHLPMGNCDAEGFRSDGSMSNLMFTDDLFGCINNGPHSNSIAVDELIWLATMWDFTNGEFIDFHALRCNGAENSITKTSVGVVVFNRENSALGRPTTLQQASSIDGNDAVEIDHANGNAC